MLELIKLLLYRNHENENHPTTKCFLPIIVKILVKNQPFSNASWDHNFELQNSKLCEVIELSFLILKIKFLWGRAYQISGRDKWKTGTKLENAQFSRALKGNFHHFLLEW